MRSFLLVVVGAAAASAFFFFFQTPAAAPAVQTATAIEATKSTPPPARTEQSPQQTYKVLKVVDGDTLAIEMDGTSVTVRLIGLDTPETVDPRKDVQCFGKEASDKAKEVLAGASVSIEQDESQGELDKYGRILAYVYLPRGISFNEYMIAEGYGHEYTYDLPYKYQARFKAVEQQARENKKGLWADNACASESARTPSPSTVKPSTPAPTGGYECSQNVYNCSSFKTQSEAQAAFDSCGGAANDVHKLDSDKDGVVCESLP